MQVLDVYYFGEAHKELGCCQTKNNKDESWNLESLRDATLHRNAYAHDVIQTVYGHTTDGPMISTAQSTS